MRFAALSAVLLLAACAGQPVDPNAACAALKQPIPAGAIGLPTGGADDRIRDPGRAYRSRGAPESAVRAASARSGDRPRAARALPGRRRDRAGRSEGAADPLPGQSADAVERQFAAVRRRRLQRRADHRPCADAVGAPRPAGPARARLRHLRHRLRAPECARRAAAGLRAERRGAGEFRVRLLQEGARRGGRADEAALRRGAEEALFLRQLGRRPRRRHDGAALSGRLRRHFQPRAGDQLGRAAGGRHARRRRAVRRRLALARRSPGSWARR